MLTLLGVTAGAARSWIVKLLGWIFTGHSEAPAGLPSHHDCVRPNHPTSDDRNKEQDGARGVTAVDLGALVAAGAPGLRDTRCCNSPAA